MKLENSGQHVLKVLFGMFKSFHRGSAFQPDAYTAPPGSAMAEERGPWHPSPQGTIQIGKSEDIAKAVCAYTAYIFCMISSPRVGASS